MEFVKNILFIALGIILIITPLLISEPPDLPVAIYGQIRDSDNNIITNAKVTAIWKSVDNRTISRTTYTKVFDDSSEAYYTFLDLNSPVDTVVILESNNIKVKVISSPGIPIKAPDIIVSLDKGFIGNIVSSISNFLGTKSKSTLSSSGSSSSSSSSTSPTLSDNTNNISDNNTSGSNNLVNLDKDSSSNDTKNTLPPPKDPNKRAPVISEFPGHFMVCEDSVFSETLDVDYPYEGLEYSKQVSEGSPFMLKVVNNNPPNYRYRIYSDRITKSSSTDGIKGSRDYYFKFMVNDESHMDEKTILFNVIEKNHAPVLENINQRTIELDKKEKYIYEVKASDIEDGSQKQGNLTFELTTTNYKMNISYLGILNFQPSRSDIGNYNVTICVIDRGIGYPSKNISYCGTADPLMSCDNFTLTVTETNSPPEIVSYEPIYPYLMPTSKVPIVFTIEKKDIDGNIPESLWYLDNILVKTSDTSTIDRFRYGFDCSMSNNHTLTLKVSDGKEARAVQWNITIDKETCFKEEREKRLKESTSRLARYIIITASIIILIIVLLLINYLKMNFERKNLNRMKNVR